MSILLALQMWVSGLFGLGCGATTEDVSGTSTPTDESAIVEGPLSEGGRADLVGVIGGPYATGDDAEGAGAESQTQGTDGTDGVTYLALPTATLSVDRTMFTLGEPAEATFTLTVAEPPVPADQMPATVALVNTQTLAIDYELALESASKEQATYSAVISVGALEPTQLTYVARGGAALGEAAGASASPEDPSAAFYLESNEVTLRVAPAITDDMVASAQRLCDAVQQQVDEAYPDGNPDENALQLVYDYLTQHTGAVNVTMAAGAVLYESPDGIACMYTLPPQDNSFDFGNLGTAATNAAAAAGGIDFSDPNGYATWMRSRNAFAQDTELTRAFETGSVPDDLRAYNDQTITNRDVLFLQSDDSLTLTDYHEGLCEDIADFTGGDYTALKGGSTFFETLCDGSLADYGTVVVNTHGNANEVRRADGTWQSWLMLYGEADWWRYDKMLAQCLYNGYEMGEGDGCLLRIAAEGGIFVSTDFIMDRYADVTFDNTVFYLAICNLMQDETFTTFLIQHGAQAVIGSWGELFNFVDYDYCGMLGELLTSVQDSGAHTWSLLSAMRESNFDAIGMMMVYRTSDFFYWGEGAMRGTVAERAGGADGEGEATPVANADIALYRFINQRFEVLDVTRADEQGRFSFGARSGTDWGTYVLEVTAPDGRRAYADVNFGADDIGCGTIYLESGADADAAIEPLPLPEAGDADDEADAPEQEPGPGEPEKPAEDDAAGVDVDGTLALYLRETLLPQCGGLGTAMGVSTYDASYEANPDGVIWPLAANAEGIVGADLADLDADGQSELVVLRLAGQYGTDGAVAGMAIYVEVYEFDASLGAYRSDALLFTTPAIASASSSLQLALFTSQLPGGGVGINLYAGTSMNEHVEVIRQFSYDGTCLWQTAATALWQLNTATVWFQGSDQHVADASAGTVLAGGEPQAQELFHGTLESTDAWAEHARMTAPNDDPLDATYVEQTQALLGEYRAFWTGQGLARNATSFYETMVLAWPGPSPIDEPDAFSARQAFDDDGTLGWVAEFNAILTHDGSNLKVVNAVEHTGLTY